MIYRGLLREQFAIAGYTEEDTRAGRTEQHGDIGIYNGMQIRGRRRDESRLRAAQRNVANAANQD